MRRYFQFRLRTALLLVTLAAVPCGWIGGHLRQWQVEQRVLAAIGPAAVENASNPYLDCL